MYYISPSKGKISFEQMMEDIIQFIEGAPDSSYKLIVGSDSQVKSDTCFITAVVIHRQGKGAKYYYRKKRQRKIESLRQKIFYETSLSLEVGAIISKYLAETGLEHLEVEIHIDVGRQGDTRNLIKEVVGMVTGSGFQARIKPDAFGASSVADKYTK